MILVVAAAGCSSGENADAAKGGSAADASKGDASVLVGSFQVRAAAATEATGTTAATQASSSIIGKIYDGPALSNIIWEESLKEGSCSLFTPRVPFCTTSCGGSAACVENETCKPYPLAHGAGTVTVSGLRLESGDTSFSMSPVVNAYQPPVAAKLLFPPFAEGDDIRFDAAGDYFGAFSLQAKGVAPFQLSNSTYELVSGKAFGLVWLPAKTADASVIKVKLDISHHGGSKGKIECTAPDTGSVDISAALVTKLIDLGIAGYPSIIVSREATGSAVIAPGRVDLVVSSEVEHAVTVAGLASCTTNAQCEAGRTCQSDLRCK